MNKAQAGKQLERLIKAAEGGLMAAQYRLGVIYTEGELVNPSFKTSYYWFEKAANAGHAYAQLYIAQALEVGKAGGLFSHWLAFKWYKEAAKLGLADAQYGVARLRGKLCVVQP